MYIGFVIIVIAWVAQIYQSLFRKEKTISSIFLLLYAVGSLVLAIGYMLNKMTMVVGLLNATLVVVAAIVLSAIMRKPK